MDEYVKDSVVSGVAVCMMHPQRRYNPRLLTVGHST